MAAALLLLKKCGLTERSSNPGKEVELKGEACALGLLGETLFSELRLASCDLGLFLEGLALFGEAAFAKLRLASCDYGRPDGTYPGGDTTERYD